MIYLFINFSYDQFELFYGLNYKCKYVVTQIRLKLEFQFDELPNNLNLRLIYICLIFVNQFEL